jgi:hypothetical protein
VHPYDGDVARVLLLELPQLRKYVNAVDSAVGPEVEEEQLPAEVGEREPAAARMNPLEIRREVGSVVYKAFGEGLTEDEVYDIVEYMYSTYRSRK